MTSAPTRIAVLIPCRDEARSIAAVVADFRRELPVAEIWVIDNGSADATAAIARAAGARTLDEPRRGKGRALRTALRAVTADLYVIADGDGQIPPEAVHGLIEPILTRTAAMVIGTRAASERMSPRLVNELGNRGYARLVAALGGRPVSDPLSGFRALEGGFGRSVRLASTGFEVDAELTIRALLAGLPVAEAPFAVRPRQPGTRSHLRVVRDGLRILRVVLAVYAAERLGALLTRRRNRTAASERSR